MTMTFFELEDMLTGDPSEDGYMLSKLAETDPEDGYFLVGCIHIVKEYLDGPGDFIDAYVAWQKLYRAGLLHRWGGYPPCDSAYYISLLEKFQREPTQTKGN